MCPPSAHSYVLLLRACLTPKLWTQTGEWVERSSSSSCPGLSPGLTDLSVGDLRPHVPVPPVPGRWDEQRPSNRPGFRVQLKQACAALAASRAGRLSSSAQRRLWLSSEQRRPSLSRANWRGAAGGIVNMAVQAAAPAYCVGQAFVGLQPARLIACFCTAAAWFCMFNCQVKSFCLKCV